MKFWHPLKMSTEALGQLNSSSFPELVMRQICNTNLKSKGPEMEIQLDHIVVAWRLSKCTPSDAKNFLKR